MLAVVRWPQPPPPPRMSDDPSYRAKPAAVLSREPRGSMSAPEPEAAPAELVRQHLHDQLAPVLALPGGARRPVERRRDDRARAHRAARRGGGGAGAAPLSTDAAPPAARHRHPFHARPCVGAILAGGRATRMGGAAKGLELVH